MKESRLNVRFCGFGGQGIVLASIIFGTTSVIKAGLNAVQMQSYGSSWAAVAPPTGGSG